jgi:lysophospholipase L1-like esterase
VSKASRARWVARGAARGAAVGGTGGALLGIFGFGVLWGEAKLARRTISPPKDGPPLTRGEYGDPHSPSLRLAVLGDSSAAGIGCSAPEQTPAHLLAETLAKAGRHVSLEVHAVSGARSADLEPQVDRALLTPPHVAIFSIGANDVTHWVRPDEACADLADAVARLVAAGVSVVVGTCPDLGTVRPVAQPLRFVARVRSSQMAAAQEKAVAEAGGVPVPLGALLSTAFSEDPEGLFCEDRFHPSGAGYRLFAEALAPLVLDAAGLPVPRPEEHGFGRRPAPERVRDAARTDARARPGPVADRTDPTVAPRR